MKLKALRPFTLFQPRHKGGFNTGVFLKYCKIFTNSFFIEHHPPPPPPLAAFVSLMN